MIRLNDTIALLLKIRTLFTGIDYAPKTNNHFTDLQLISSACAKGINSFIKNPVHLDEYDQIADAL